MASGKLKWKGFEKTKLFLGLNDLGNIEAMNYPELREEIRMNRIVTAGKIENLEFHFRIPYRQCLFEIHKLENEYFHLKNFVWEKYSSSLDQVDYLLSNVLRDEVIEVAEWIAAVCYMPDTDFFPEARVQMIDFRNPSDDSYEIPTLILETSLGNSQYLVAVFLQDSQNPLPRSFVFWKCKIIGPVTDLEWFSRKPLVIGIGIDELEKHERDPKN